MEKMRTLAFQVPESLFQRIKDYLHRNNMTQKKEIKRRFQLWIRPSTLELADTLYEKTTATAGVNSSKKQSCFMLDTFPQRTTKPISPISSHPH